MKWEAQTSNEHETEAWLQWSQNKEEGWNGLAVGIKQNDSNTSQIDISSLPSGKIFVRLLVHDGFFTTISDPISIEIPSKPPSVAILYPKDNSKILAGGGLRLWGSAISSSGNPIEPSFAHWIIDDKEVARGLDVFIKAPEEGEHNCILVVDYDTQVTEKKIRFRTIAIPRVKIRCLAIYIF